MSKGQLVEYLREEDYKKFIDRLDQQNNVVMKNLVIVATKVGLRISDLLKLKFEDILEGSIKLVETKTKKNRDVKLNTVAQTSIQALEEFYKSEGYELGGYIFKAHSRRNSDKKDIAVTDRTVNRNLNTLKDYFNISYPVGTHSLRKKFGRDVYQATKDIALVMKVLNHSSQSVTLAYIGIEKEVISNVYDLI